MRELTQDALTSERNLFLAGCLSLWWVRAGWAVLFRVLAEDLVLAHQEPSAFNAVVFHAGYLAIWAAWVYLVYRLSRFLRQPAPLTLAYCVMMALPLPPFWPSPSMVGLIAIVGLLLAVRNTRPSIPLRSAQGQAARSASVPSTAQSSEGQTIPERAATQRQKADAIRPTSEVDTESTAPCPFMPVELAKVGVDIVDCEPLMLRCQKCGSAWIVLRTPDGQLPEGYWHCDNGCNVSG